MNSWEKAEMELDKHREPLSRRAVLTVAALDLIAWAIIIGIIVVIVKLVRG